VNRSPLAAPALSALLGWPDRPLPAAVVHELVDVVARGGGPYDVEEAADAAGFFPRLDACAAFHLWVAAAFAAEAPERNDSAEAADAAARAAALLRASDRPEDLAAARALLERAWAVVAFFLHDTEQDAG
jgi:hypothetical protein